MIAKIISYREIEEGEAIPRFYGIAYQDPLSFRFICYPFPLNHLIGFISRWVWKHRNYNRFVRFNTLKRMISNKVAQAHEIGYYKGRMKQSKRELVKFIIEQRDKENDIQAGS